MSDIDAEAIDMMAAEAARIICDLKQENRALRISNYVLLAMVIGLMILWGIA